jgi:phosphatidylglycerophosphate synthase
LHADALTSAGVVAAAGAGALFAVGVFPLASLVVAVSGAADILDGAVARSRSGGTGKRGAFFDSAADRVSDNLIYGGIFLYYASLPGGDPVAIIAIFVAASASNVASYLKSQSEAAGLPCSVGMFKRQERFLVIIVGGFFGPSRFVAVLLILATFALASTTRRFVYVYWRMLP